jgi:hypothetical protein
MLLLAMARPGQVQSDGLSINGLLIPASRDGAYVQFIRPKGNLEQNLRNQLRA